MIFFILIQIIFNCFEINLKYFTIVLKRKKIVEKNLVEKIIFSEKK